MSECFKQTPKCLRLFAAYALLLILYDVFRLLCWWPFTDRPLTLHSNWPLSTPYCFALILMFSFLLSVGPFNKWTLGRDPITRLPGFICLLMGIEILRGLIIWMNKLRSHDEREALHFVEFLVISVLIPSLWIKVWLSASCSEYLRKCAGLSTERQLD